MDTPNNPTLYNTGGSDFLGNQFLVTLGVEAGAMSCAQIAIQDDSVFEDVESFRAVLVTDPGVPGVQTGETNVTVISIDDVGK